MAIHEYTNIPKVLTLHPHRSVLGVVGLMGTDRLINCVVDMLFDN